MTPTKSVPASNAAWASRISTISKSAMCCNASPCRSRSSPKPPRSLRPARRCHHEVAFGPRRDFGVPDDFAADLQLAFGSHRFELIAMPVGLLTLEIYIPDSHSLKDKRQVLRSLKERLRARFNVAVAELDHNDTWQRAQVGVVSLSNDEAHLQQSLQAVFQEAENLLGRDLIDHTLEIL